MPGPFGHNGIWTTPIGLGTGGLGGPHVDQADVDRLIHGAIDLGVGLIDTAPSYGGAEERIGRALAGRRGAMVISTKVGYGVPGVPDWTGPCVEQGIELARQRLGVDVIDIAHLHSCRADVLHRGDVVEALVRAAERTAIRVPAYSGDGHALWTALETGAFGSVQATLSVIDRHNRPTLALARERGLGLIAKRALGNAPWRWNESPEAPDLAENWRRWQALALELGDADPMQVSLRWVLHHTEVHSVLVGTRRLENLQRAVEALEAGPLEADVLTHLNARWEAEGTTWSPLV
jgi:aryl-alcohol dehydrogenase-like predicted oxidoreductase